MIYALLFLILFAILFPKALRFLLALMFIGGIILLSEVHAKPAQCFLNVGGKVYIDGICDYDEGKDGSFTIGANGKSRYFAYVFPGGDSYWNGIEAESHANAPLGVLSRSGACWANDRAKVCAWKIIGSGGPNTSEGAKEFDAPNNNKNVQTFQKDIDARNDLNPLDETDCADTLWIWGNMLQWEWICTGAITNPYVLGRPKHVNLEWAARV